MVENAANVSWSDLMPASARRLDLHVAGGRLCASSFGDTAAPLVLCIPGLTANQRAYDVIAPRLAMQHRHVVALDLRGRGHSEVTPPGTYGWESHAVDVIEVAAQLGARSFDVIGHSMGAYVTMHIAHRTPERLRRAVLIDAVGAPEAAAVPPIVAGVERLGAVQPSVDAHVARMRATGSAEPWSDMWRRYFTWELTEREGGVVTLTSRDAVVEDMTFGATHHPEDLWPAMGMPTLVVRATRPVVPGTGLVIPADAYQRFLCSVPAAHGVEVDANHYGVVADEDTVAAIERFLAA